jgi:hypothetical protein
MFVATVNAGDKVDNMEPRVPTTGTKWDSDFVPEGPNLDCIILFINVHSIIVIGRIK